VGSASLAALDPSAPFTSLLPGLFEGWRARRQPTVARLVEAISAALLAEAPRPLLGASKKASERELWWAVHETRDVLDFPRLMAAARGGSQQQVRAQVEALAEWQHPAFAAGLLSLLEGVFERRMRARLSGMKAALEAALG
jgi:hypothetical protein